MKKKLYLHIGSHKTGTTSIQKVLESNTKYLSKYHFSFFSENIIGKRISSGNTNRWLSINNFGLIKGKGVSVKNLYILGTKLSRMKHDNVIMSAEHFSWIFQKKVLEELHTELKKHFEEIKIIVYLRRQDEHIISHHQQGSKSARSPEAKFYGNQPRAIPEKTLSLHSYYLDYHKKLSLWKDIFGKDNLIVRVFDKNKLINNDIVSDFFSILGIPVPSVGSLRLNESNGFEKTKVSHMLNEHIEDRKLRYFIQDYLNDDGKLIPSKSKALQYYQLFEESNKKLEKEFNIKFDENFDKYPQNDMDVWDEESANRALSNILIAINDYNKKSLFTRIRIYIKKLRDLIKKSQAAS